MLYLGKNYDIKGLELVGAFGGKCKDENIVFICKSPELISLMRIMTIKEKKDGGVVYLMCLGK